MRWKFASPPSHWLLGWRKVAIPWLSLRNLREHRSREQMTESERERERERVVKVGYSSPPPARRCVQLMRVSPHQDVRLTRLVSVWANCGARCISGGSRCLLFTGSAIMIILLFFWRIFDWTVRLDTRNMKGTISNYCFLFYKTEKPPVLVMEWFVFKMSVIQFPAVRIVLLQRMLSKLI